MGFGIVVRVMGVRSQQLSMSWAISHWYHFLKAVPIIAKPVPGFCYHIGHDKATISQPVPGCRKTIYKYKLNVLETY